MTSRRDFENVVQDWLEIGPTRLSEGTIETARARVHKTRQARASRVSWRFPMSQSTRILAASLAALLVVVTVGMGVRFLSTNNGAAPTLVPNVVTAPPSSSPVASPTVQPSASTPAPVVQVFPVVQPIAAGPALHLAWQTGGPSSTAALSAPTIAPDGRIWVASGRDGTFWIYTPSGKLAGTWGTPGNAEGQFDFVYRSSGFDDPFGGIAFGPDGSFWVLDTGNFRVQHFDKNRIFLGSWGGFGTGNGQFAEAIAIGVDRAGHVYVDDAVRRDIQMFESNGQYLKTFAKGVAGAALRVHPEGWVLTSGLPDGSTGITSYKPDQTVQGVLNLTLVFPGVGTLDLDADRNMYIGGLNASGDAQGLIEFTEGGDTVAFWPTPAENLVVSSKGDAVYVTSHLWSRLRKYDLPKR
jgi:hypothetical protein